MGTANGMNSFNTAMFFAPFNQPNPATVLDIETGWTELTDVISINGVPMERSVTEITHLRSPLKAKEKVPGFLDAGQNTFRLNYFKGIMFQLQTLSPGGALAPDTSPSWGRLTFAIIFPDDGVWVFTAFIKSQ